MSDLFSDISAQLITEFHDACLAQTQWAKQVQPKYHQGVWQNIELNHRYNCLLWQEEDLARRRGVPDREIVANKRNIDGYNQKRNDAIEKIDEQLLQRLETVQRNADARLNSETAGAMVDRLSILGLKIFHMRVQTKRDDVDAEHRAACEAKLEKLIEQRGDLGNCLDNLLNEMTAGRAYYKIYRQFKMYNDPKLNPQLYQKR